MLGFGLGLAGIALRGGWSPLTLAPAFWAEGFAPPPFSPAQLLAGGAGFWANIEGTSK